MSAGPGEEDGASLCAALMSREGCVGPRPRPVPVPEQPAWGSRSGGDGEGKGRRQHGGRGDTAVTASVWSGKGQGPSEKLLAERPGVRISPAGFIHGAPNTENVSSSVRWGPAPHTLPLPLVPVGAAGAGFSHLLVPGHIRCCQSPLRHGAPGPASGARGGSRLARAASSGRGLCWSAPWRLTSFSSAITETKAQLLPRDGALGRGAVRTE